MSLPPDINHTWERTAVHVDEHVRVYFASSINFYIFIDIVVYTKYS